jgi:transposase InsO family protein
MSSRSLNDRYLPDSGVSWIDGMPPRSRNQRAPTGPDVPHASAASSLDNPSAIFTQNPRSTSRRIGGRPGDRIAGRPVSVTIHPGGLPIQHLRHEVLRRPVEFTQYTSAEFREFCDTLGVKQSMGKTGVCWDNALAESFFATYKLELIERRSWPTRARTRTATVHWIEAVYNRQRRHSAIDMLSPVDYEECYWDRRAAA